MAGKNKTYYIKEQNLKGLEDVDNKGDLINRLLELHFKEDGAEFSSHLEPTGMFQAKFDDYPTAQSALFGLYHANKGAVIVIDATHEKIFARIHGIPAEEVAVLVGEALQGKEGNVIERL